MTTAELVYEKVKTLPEPQALSVLDFVEHLPPPLSARELRRLPKAERLRLLTAQAEGAEALYREQPGLVQDCVDAPLTYGETVAR